MPLEVATYINGLDSANPAATDAKSQGDDHLRLIKSAVKNTFPNLTAPVTKTAAQINNLAQAGVNTDITSIAGNASTASSAQGPSFVTAIAGAGGEANFTCRISGQSDAYLFNNATGWGLFSNAGGVALEYNRASGKFVFFGKAATLGSGGAGGTAMTFNYSGQSGQPTWVWGSNTLYGDSNLVWNPSNFNVKYATSAGTANDGLGNGVSWQLVTGSRSAGVSYTNSSGRTRVVMVEMTSTGGPNAFTLSPVVDNVGLPSTTAYSANNGYMAMSIFIVPNGKTYAVGIYNANMTKWAELG